MARIFITGSSDGIGLSAAKILSDKGHSVVLHARNADRAASTRAAVPKAESVLIGDLRSISETKKLAEEANNKPFDTIIHNAGIGFGSTSSKEITSENISAVFAVNTLAPYILTCLMDRPKSRLLYMSSDSHYGGDEKLRNDVTKSHSYSDSKLHDVMLANAFSRRWGEDIQVVSMHPGWVRTKMGGSMAPGGMDKPAKALAEWAAGEGKLAGLESGTFFTTRGEESAHPGAENVSKQEELLKICEKVSGVSVPDERNYCIQRRIVAASAPKDSVRHANGVNHGGDAAEATTVWNTLWKCLPHRQHDWDYWWQFSGQQMAILLLEAGYTVHDQYEALLFYYHHVVPRLGRAPGPNGKPKWKSPLSVDGSPVEWSFKWNTATSEPEIRYTIECQGDFTGTTADPFNIESTKDLMYRLSLQFPRIDLTWFHKLVAFVFDKEKGNYLASGGFPTTTMMLAFELLKTGFMVKAYFIAPKPPLGSAARVYDVEFWESAVRMLASSSLAADTAFSFLRTNIHSQALHPVALSIDCVVSTNSRVKLYLQSPDTRFDSVREIMTMGSSITGLDAQLDDLYDLIKSITGLPTDHPSSKPVPVTAACHENNPESGDKKTEPLSGYVYYFDIKPGAAVPDIKFYIPTRQYAKTDTQVADGLTKWMQERNRGQYAGNYKRMLSAISTHRQLWEGNGLHAFVSFAFLKGETHVTSYIGPEAYHLRRLRKGRQSKRG